MQAVILLYGHFLERKQQTDRALLFYILTIIVVFLAAFLYFRATFPH